MSVAVHFIDVCAKPAGSAWSSATASKGETFAMTVDRAMFDFMEGMWEAPTPDEWQANGGLLIKALRGHEMLDLIALGTNVSGRGTVAGWSR